MGSGPQPTILAMLIERSQKTAACAKWDQVGSPGLALWHRIIDNQGMATRHSVGALALAVCVSACVAGRQNSDSPTAPPSANPEGAELIDDTGDGPRPEGVVERGIASDCMDGATVSLLEDAEDDDAQVNFTGGRDGAWYSATDEKGSQFSAAEIKPAPGGTNSTKKAMHFEGKVASEPGSWTMVGVSMLSDDFYDASKYSGIMFYAKGKGAAKKVRVAVPDTQTSPEGGTCKECHNHFGKDITLTSDWKQYTITFDEMTQQKGWGDQFDALEATDIVGIQWSITEPGKPFDLWIDEVQLLCADGG